MGRKYNPSDEIIRAAAVAAIPKMKLVADKIGQDADAKRIRYDDEGRRGYVADGLAPAFRVAPTTGAPEIIASAGNVDNAAENKTMKTREWRGHFARALADGVAAMLRQQ